MTYDKQWFEDNKTRKILIFAERYEQQVITAAGNNSKEPSERLYGDGVEVYDDAFSLCCRADTLNPKSLSKAAALYTRFKIKYDDIKSAHNFGTGNLIIIIKE